MALAPASPMRLPITLEVKSKIGREVSHTANHARDKTHRSNIGLQQKGTTSQEKSPTKKAAQHFQRNTHLSQVMLLLGARASAMALAPTSPMLLKLKLEVESKIGRHVSRSANDARDKNTLKQHRPTAKRHDVTGKTAHKEGSTALPAEYPLEAGDAAVVLEGLCNGPRTRVANAVAVNAGGGE